MTPAGIEPATLRFVAQPTVPPRCPQNGVLELITVIKIVNKGQHFGNRIGPRLQVTIITSDIQNLHTQTRIKQIFKNYDLDWKHLVQGRARW